MKTNNTNHREIGARIKELREARGMSQQALAELLGYQTDTAVSLIESGERKLSIEKLVILAETFDVPLEELLGKARHTDVKVALRSDKNLSDRDMLEIERFIDFIKQKGSND